MNGVHDMGGMHGFGSVDIDDDAAFHDNWEKTVFAIEKLLRYQSVYEVNEKRYALERLNPVKYLEASYFERWALGAEMLLLETETITETEYAEAIEDHDGTGLLDLDPSENQPSSDKLVEIVHKAFGSDAAHDREPVEPEFEAGSKVVVENDHPSGHNRCPRYVRRAQGTVESIHGTYVVPDEAAHGNEAAEPLYSVRFKASELWNNDRDGDAVYIDLWERYLNATDESQRSDATHE